MNDVAELRLMSSEGYGGRLTEPIEAASGGARPPTERRPDIGGPDATEAENRGRSPGEGLRGSARYCSIRMGVEAMPERSSWDG